MSACVNSSVPMTTFLTHYFGGGLIDKGECYAVEPGHEQWRNTPLRYEDNSAWQVFSVIAFNLMRALQAGTAERRSMNRKRRTIRPFRTIQTLRYRFINRAGLLVQPNRRQILDVGDNPTVRERY